MKTVVYIDGQNFLYKVSEVLIREKRINEKQKLHTLSIRKLFEKLLGGNNIEIRYYGTRLRRYKEPPDIAEKSTIFIDQLRKLKNSLSAQDIEYIESGRLKLRDGDKCKSCGRQDYHFQEKGVDVKIAVDLLNDASQKDIGRLVLVSSDNDLLPAVMSVTKKDVVYIGFGDKLTKSLVTATKMTQIIRDAEIVEAFDDANPAPLNLV